MPSRPSLSIYRGKRDFAKTSEPRGTGADSPRAAGPQFVIQRHDASHLHYDLRLELAGVMKSWAVPKGPSLDPSVKRLAVEVEDHPLEYNAFEGTIPKGEYGGGTVMLWDRGTYTADEARPGESNEKALRRGYRAGKISVTFHGERLRGSFALVRTSRGTEGKPQWLLIKHRDDNADEKRDITAEFDTSVVTGRTLEEIARGKGGSRTWHSNRGGASTATKKERAATQPSSTPSDLSALSPMLAKSGATVSNEAEFTFEPKYDGIRVLAYATEQGAALITRNGNDKAEQFPEVTAALAELVSGLGKPVVLDGEIVGLRDGEIVRFESLQGRMHLTGSRRIQGLAKDEPAALVVFDLLLGGDDAFLHQPWHKRRKRLEALLKGRTNETLRLGATSRNRKEMEKRATHGEWEGLIAKRIDSTYHPGQRTGEWVKLKLEDTQEFVVGGWTEPRRSRQHLGAILLGYYQGDEFIYAGHTGTGFNAAALNEMERRLRRLERKTPPFSVRPATNEKAHWVTPRVVVQIRFNEWTSRGVVRQPVFVGFRDDKDPRDVIREGPASLPSPAGAKKTATNSGSPKRSVAPPSRPRDTAPDGAVVRQIHDLQKAKKGGVLNLGGDRLAITNPQKIFFPKKKITKGDLLAYYAEVAGMILPWMKDRPLVLKRYPNGIDDKAFYQQAAPEDAPEGVRVENVALTDEKTPKPRLVGGALATLLYTVQLGAISYDPWHSRVDDLLSADYSILDLDPGPGASFQRVIQVALWIAEEMDALGLHGALKTSGSRGVHIYLPLAIGTPLDAATLLAQIVATRVATRHPAEATVERMVKKRRHGTVYVDFLQNILGKTVAGVYAVRAKPEGTVSTPLAWSELGADLDPRDFTLRSVPERIRERGDMWTTEMAQPNSLEKLVSGAGIPP